MRGLILSLGMLLAAGGAQAQWREPPRTMAPSREVYAGCRAVDGDTLACTQGHVRLRGVDTPERGESGYREAQQELQRRVGPGGGVVVVPHHRDRWGRVVGDVYSRAGEDIGRSMDAAGWSKANGARR